MKKSLLLLIALVFGGCASTDFGASSRFISQWNTIGPGMTAAEVRELLGKPFASYIPTDGDTLTEYWRFTNAEFDFIPPSDAFVILYDKDLKVKSVSFPRQQKKT